MRRHVGTARARIGAVLLGVLLAAGGLPRATVRADVAPSVMIVAGQSIGPVRLGMAAAAVTSVLGNPVAADGGQVRFPRIGITVTLEDGAVVRVSTTNPQFRTARGLGVGISVDDSVRLIGDPNQTVAVTGSETTVSYPFQGLGFVFRGERAVEIFVEQAIARNPSLPPPVPEAIPTFPPTDEDFAQPPLPSDTAPPAAPRPPAQIAQTAPPPSGPAVEARDVADSVDASRGVLRITGKVANTNPQDAGPVTISARVVRAGGPADGETGATAPQISIAPAGEAAFTLDVSLTQSVVLRYLVEAVVVRAGTTSRLVLAQRTVPREAYADLARTRVQVSVALGAPANNAPRVQVLVAIAGTGPIPPDWVRQVEVEIPFTGGSTTVTLIPGQTQTILVPSVARVGEPLVQRVDLNAS